MVYLPNHTQTQRKNQMVIPASSPDLVFLASEDFYIANLFPSILCSSFGPHLLGSGVL
jgi:hypothetical protein